MVNIYRPGFLVLLALSLIAASACSDPIFPTVSPPPTVTPVAPSPTPVDTTSPEPVQEVSTEPGLTSDVMRIAVIADGENSSINDGESESIWQAVEAWATAVNQTSKLAGRTVVVERIDSAVSRHAEAIEQVCTGDYFALIGSSSINDSEGLSLLSSPECSLPDFPAFIYSAQRLNSEITFVSNPAYSQVTNAGWAAYFSRVNPDAVERAATLFPELSPLVLGGNQTIEAATATGYRFIHSPIYNFETDFLLEAESLIESDARSLTWRNSGSQLLSFLGAINQVDPDFRFDFIDCGQNCYSQNWVAAAGDFGEGVSVWLPYLPIEEAELSDELLRYLFYLLSTHGSEGVTSAAGVAAWSAGLLFEEAVSRAVGLDSAAYDPDSLTREAVIEAAKTINFWDANGLHGVSNPSEGIPSPCFVVITLQDGLWKRSYPSRPGELDCEDSNLVTLAALQGLTQENASRENPE
ncbi:MAG: ABC transporter substrate-binding protein [Acidimicrobiales bacterium]|tara:strand:- start:2 stop:1402 length:1401 start_codon:yes stop_codon:yes gene_type:complete